MNFTDTITDQLKAAMKNGDKLRLETLRSLRAAILEFEKSGIDRAMTNDDVTSLLLQAAKKRKDAIDQFRSAGREEAAVKEEQELQIINEFLPKQLTREELAERLKEIAQQVGATQKTDFAKVMGVAMKELRGLADGAVIRQMVTDMLS